MFSSKQKSLLVHTDTPRRIRNLNWFIPYIFFVAVVVIEISAFFFLLNQGQYREQ